MSKLSLKLLSWFLNKILSKFGNSPKLVLKIYHQGISYYLQILNPQSQNDYINIKWALFLYYVQGKPHYEKLSPKNSVYNDLPKDVSSNTTIKLPIWLIPRLIESDDKRKRFGVESNILVNIQDSYRLYMLDYPSNKEKIYNKFSWKLSKMNINRKLKNRTEDK